MELLEFKLHSLSKPEMIWEKIENQEETTSKLESSQSMMIIHKKFLVLSMINKMDNMLLSIQLKKNVK